MGICALTRKEARKKLVKAVRDDRCGRPQREKTTVVSAYFKAASEVPAMQNLKNQGIIILVCV